MGQTAAAVLAITACFLLVVYTDQGFDCRKLVYTPHCRGIARKRGESQSIEMQSGIPHDDFSSKRLSYELGSAKQESLQESMSTLRKNEMNKQQADNLLYKLFMTGKIRDDDDGFPLYEY